MTASNRPARWLLAAVAAAGCAGLVAACSSAGSSNPSSAAGKPGTSSTPSAGQSGSGSGAGSGAGSGSGSGQAGSSACATSALRASVPAIGNAASGHTGYPVNLTNDSAAPCTLTGYPGVSFVSGPGGTQIGAAAARATTAYLFTAQAAKAITLAPGQTAHADLQLIAAGAFPPAQCRPVTVHWLRVYPPNQTAPLYVNLTAQTCSSAQDMLTVSPVQPVGAPSP